MKRSFHLLKLTYTVPSNIDLQEITVYFYIIYLGTLSVNCDFQLRSVTTAITAMTIFL
jgi:hypothetical protein